MTVMVRTNIVTLSNITRHATLRSVNISGTQAQPTPETLGEKREVLDIVN